MSKTCTQCQTRKSLEEYPKNSKMVDGRLNKCRTCMNAYYKEYNKNRSNKGINDDALTKYLKYKLINIVKQDQNKFPEHECKLTIEDLKEIFYNYKGTCTYSNQKLVVGKKTSIYKKISFDRIDNNLPHLKENLQLTSQFMNMLRGNKTDEEFRNELNNSP